MNINPIIFELFQKLDKNENRYQNNLYSAKCCFKKPKNKENIYKVKSAEKEIRYIKIFQVFCPSWNTLQKGKECFMLDEIDYWNASKYFIFFDIRKVKTYKGLFSKFQPIFLRLYKWNKLPNDTKWCKMLWIWSTW